MASCMTSKLPCSRANAAASCALRVRVMSDGIAACSTPSSSASGSTSPATTRASSRPPATAGPSRRPQLQRRTIYLHEPAPPSAAPLPIPPGSRTGRRSPRRRPVSCSSLSHLRDVGAQSRPRRHCVQPTRRTPCPARARAGHIASGHFPDSLRSQWALAKTSGHCSRQRRSGVLALPAACALAGQERARPECRRARLQDAGVRRPGGSRSHRTGLHAVHARARDCANCGPPLRRISRAWPDGASNPAGIVVSAGAKQALFNACFTLFGPGDDVIVPAPYWTSYPEIVTLARATDRRRRAASGQCAEGRCRPILERVLTPATRGLIINSPNNPTGAVYERHELDAILLWAAERGLWVISDEIYGRLCYDGSSRDQRAAPRPVAAGTRHCRGRSVEVLRHDRLARRLQLLICGDGEALRRRCRATSRPARRPRRRPRPSRRTATSRGCGKPCSPWCVSSSAGGSTPLSALQAALPRAEFTMPDGAFYIFVRVDDYYTRATRLRSILPRPAEERRRRARARYRVWRRSLRPAFLRRARGRDPRGDTAHGCPAARRGRDRRRRRQRDFLTSHARTGADYERHRSRRRGRPRRLHAGRTTSMSSSRRRSCSPAAPVTASDHRSSRCSSSACSSTWPCFRPTPW
jgi:hypothetical protein